MHWLNKTHLILEILYTCAFFSTCVYANSRYNRRGDQIYSDELNTGNWNSGGRVPNVNHMRNGGEEAEKKSMYHHRSYPSNADDSVGNEDNDCIQKVDLTMTEVVLNRLTCKYDGVVVAIGDDVPENDTLVENIKYMFRDAQKRLEFSTKRRASFYSDGFGFGQVTITVPDFWDDELKPLTKVLGSPSIKVDPPHPSYGDTPYTLQPGGCGERGLFIHLTPSYVASMKEDHVKDSLGEPGKILVHEWAHLRWGVFDEYVERTKLQRSDSSAVHPFYFDDDNQIRASACTADIKGWLLQEPQEADQNGNKNVGQNTNASEPQQCQSTTADGLPGPGCLFYPDRNKIVGSYMSYFSNKTDDVTFEAFCGRESFIHNPDAPTPHNINCNGNSVWDVMMQHDDFPPDCAVTRRNLKTGFSVLRRVVPRSVLLLVTCSTSIQGNFSIIKSDVLRFVELFLNDKVSITLVCINSNGDYDSDNNINSGSNTRSDNNNGGSENTNTNTVSNGNRYTISTSSSSSSSSSSSNGNRRERSANAISIHEKNTDERSTDEKSTDERSTDEKNTDERSTDEKSTNERSTDGKSTDERSTDGKSTGERSTDEKSTSEKSIYERNINKRRSNKRNKKRNRSHQFHVTSKLVVTSSRHNNLRDWHYTASEVRPAVRINLNNYTTVLTVSSALELSQLRNRLNIARLRCTVDHVVTDGSCQSNVLEGRSLCRKYHPLKEDLSDLLQQLYSRRVLSKGGIEQIYSTVHTMIRASAGGDVRDEGSYAGEFFMNACEGSTLFVLKLPRADHQRNDGPEIWLEDSNGRKSRYPQPRYDTLRGSTYVAIVPCSESTGRWTYVIKLQASHYESTQQTFSINVYQDIDETLSIRIETVVLVNNYQKNVGASNNTSALDTKTATTLTPETNASAQTTEDPSEISQDYLKQGSDDFPNLQETYINSSVKDGFDSSEEINTELELRATRSVTPETRLNGTISYNRTVSHPPQVSSHTTSETKSVLIKKNPKHRNKEAARMKWGTALGATDGGHGRLRRRNASPCHVKGSSAKRPFLKVKYGSTVRIVAVLRQGEYGQDPVLGASVMALITRNEGVDNTKIVLEDTGLNADMTADDGQYSGSLTEIFSGDGDYKVVVEASSGNTTTRVFNTRRTKHHGSPSDVYVVRVSCKSGSSHSSIPVKLKQGTTAPPHLLATLGRAPNNSRLFIGRATVPAEALLVVPDDCLLLSLTETGMSTGAAVKRSSAGVHGSMVPRLPVFRWENFNQSSQSSFVIDNIESDAEDGIEVKPVGSASNANGGVTSTAPIFLKKKTLEPIIVYEYTTLDILPPGRVKDLEVMTVYFGQTPAVELKFTSPGDDGFVFTAESLELRYSRHRSVLLQEFDAASMVDGSMLQHEDDLKPRKPYTPHTVTVIVKEVIPEGLLTNYTLYFAIRAIDDEFHKGDVSNVAEAYFTRRNRVAYIEKVAGTSYRRYLIGVILVTIIAFILVLVCAIKIKQRSQKAENFEVPSDLSGATTMTGVGTNPRSRAHQQGFTYGQLKREVHQ